MGYQESWFYIEPQRKFEKMIQAYERAENSGYYKVAGAEPWSVVVLKQPFGDIPAGKRLLWVCGDSKSRLLRNHNIQNNQINTTALKKL